MGTLRKKEGGEGTPPLQFYFILEQGRGGALPEGEGYPSRGGRGVPFQGQFTKKIEGEGWSKRRHRNLVMSLPHNAFWQSVTLSPAAEARKKERYAVQKQVIIAGASVRKSLWRMRTTMLNRSEPDWSTATAADALEGACKAIESTLAKAMRLDDGPLLAFAAPFWGFCVALKAEVTKDILLLQGFETVPCEVVASCESAGNRIKEALR